MIEPTEDDFTEGLQPIAAVLGVETVRDIVRHFGGTRLYIPRNWREGLPLDVLGEERARRLCERFGPERIEIPLVPWTHSAILRFVTAMDRAGRTSGEIARELGVSYKRVQRSRTATGLTGPRRRRLVDDRQIDMVDWLDGAGVPSNAELLRR